MKIKFHLKILFPLLFIGSLISGNSNRPNQIELLNAEGQEVLDVNGKDVSSNGNSWNYNLNTAALPSGIYIVQIRNGANYSAQRIEVVH